MTPFPPSLFQFFLTFTRPYYRWILTLIGCSFFRACAMSAGPYLLKIIIDTVTTYEGPPEDIMLYVWVPLLSYIGLMELINLSYRGGDYIVLRIMPPLRANVRNAVFNYAQHHSFKFFQDHMAGTIGNKILDIGASFIKIIQVISMVFIQYIGALFIAIGVVYTISPLFSLIFALWISVFLTISFFLSKNAMHYSDVFSESASTYMGQVIDSISNINNTRIFTRQNYELKRIQPYQDDYITKNRQLNSYILKRQWLQGSSITLFLGAMLYFLIQHYANGKISIGDFAFIATLWVSVIYGAFTISDNMMALFEDLGTCKQAFRLIATPHDVVDVPNASLLNAPKGEIIFNDVSFSYKHTKPLFKNKDLTLFSGQKIGLVGHSGSGKTSFTHLLLRHFDLNKGQILIDGQDISTVTQASLRQHIALIPQDITLFHRSLMENIRYGNISASDEDVIIAAKKANCHLFISALAQGYDSLAGERGIKLSGGQRQRIAIARIFLKNAPILILDEATSALDSLTESDINQSFNTLTAGRTTLVIAHRLSTLKQMDRILVFDQGQIIEDGTHNQLMAQKGTYATLWTIQSSGFI